MMFPSPSSGFGRELGRQTRVACIPVCATRGPSLGAPPAQPVRETLTPTWNLLRHGHAHVSVWTPHVARSGLKPGSSRFIRSLFFSAWTWS